MKDYDCNACGNGNCNGDVIRDKRGNFMGFKACKGHKQLLPMRVKLPECEGRVIVKNMDNPALKLFKM